LRNPGLGQKRGQGIEAHGFIHGNGLTLQADNAHKDRGDNGQGNQDLQQGETAAGDLAMSYDAIMIIHGSRRF
jgi:hypothetical protein